MKFWLSIVLPILFCCTALPAATESVDLGPEANAIMKPIVRVSTGYATGSGTILYSEDREDTGEFQTYILTNHHVVDDAIHVIKKWDSLEGKYISREENDQVTVELFLYLRGGKTVVAQPIQADIMAHDADEDLALLRLDYPIQIEHVAPILPAGRDLRMLEPCWAAGCSLGVDPIVTTGRITDLEELIEHKPYVMASADIIWGNSGGAVFILHDGRFHFAGVPSRGRVAYAQAVTHMGYFIPVERIRKWAARQRLSFLVDANATPTEAWAARKELRSNHAPAPARVGPPCED